MVESVCTTAALAGCSLLRAARHTYGVLVDSDRKIRGAGVPDMAQRALNAMANRGLTSPAFPSSKFVSHSPFFVKKGASVRSRTAHALRVCASSTPRQGFSGSSTTQRQEGEWRRSGDVETPREDMRERQQKLNELLREVGELAVATGPRGAVRLLQGVQAVAAVGAEWVREQSAGRPAAPPGPKQLRLLFERLGATYIKLGQFIASAPTLFPAEYVSEFQSCLDRTPPVDFSVIENILREELGRPLSEVYEFVDPIPLASASVAQVHAGRLKGSQSACVIKVLKPGVEDVLNADLNFLYVAARVLEFLNPDLSRTSLVGIIGDIRSSMLEEVDFLKEAANMEEFRQYLESRGLSGQACVPLVYPHCTSRRALTMERFYGVPLTDLASLRALVPSPEQTLITALNVWFGSLLACSSFHADVHAGNLLVLKDGRIGFIDFGIVGRISPLTWSAIQTFLASAGSGQYRAMAAALTQMGATSATVDVDRFAADLRKIFESVQNIDTEVLLSAGRVASATVSVDEQQANALLLDVVRVSEQYGLRFPREFGLLLKQLLYFDRYTRLLAPTLNVLEDNRVTIGSDAGLGR